MTPDGYNITNIINGRGMMNKLTKEKLSKKANEPHRINHIINLGKQNRGISRKNSKSKYCGVSFCKGKWKAVFNLGNKKIYLGTFSIEEEAAKARDITEIKHTGKDAILNFPELREQYLNNEIIVNKCIKIKKSNSNILGVSFYSKENKWVYRNKHIMKRFKTLEEVENYALILKERNSINA